MQVPSRVPLGGRSIKIEYHDRLHDSEGHSIWGEYTSGEYTIKISKSRPLSPADVWNTLHHELVHAALDLSGVENVLGEKREEAVAHCIGNLLSPLLQLRADLPGVRYRDVEFDFEDAD